MEQRQQYKRSPAVKMDVRTILASIYIKEQDMVNYMSVNDFTYSRVNLLAMVIRKPEEDPNSLWVEDSTGKIALRVFEDQGLIQRQEVGSCVLIIGKPREYNNEKYVIPEIIRKIDPGWIKVRNLELEKLHKRIGKLPEPKTESGPSSPQSQDAPGSESVVQQAAPVEEVEAVSDTAEEVKDAPARSPASGPSKQDRVYKFIKEKDSGDGVDVGLISSELGLKDSESVITTLLQNGDIFEIKPGRVKVLE